MEKKRGRPPQPDRYKLTEEQKAIVIDVALQGRSLKDMADAICVTPRHFWLARQHDPNFNILLTSARKEGVNHQVDELMKVHEVHPDPQVMRVVSDNTKWRASKLYASVYGDRIDLNVNHTVDLAGALSDAKKRAEAIESVVVRKAIEDKAVEIPDLDAFMTESAERDDDEIAGEQKDVDDIWA